jgi:hypothetical protein
MRTSLRALSGLTLVCATSSLLYAEPTCPSGETWDVSMAMCMPVATPAAGATTPSITNVSMLDRMTAPDLCTGPSYYRFGMAMCVPRPAAAGRAWAMVMGNLFLTLDGEQGPRGRITVVAPNWAMADLGVDLASWNQLQLDVMMTAERWTFPDAGYPELLQIGESNQQGQPFIDAQHPHSSPLMGLTLTDVFSFSKTRTRLVTIFFAPRGESTDGPIAMMHRPTGTVNPDAPLGHHVGQDVGHITSTVIGASLSVDGTTVEASTFHGQEPSPTAVDLPIGVPDSFALRLVQQVGKRFTVSASAAYVNDPEGEADIPHEVRVSASGYTQWTLRRGWRAYGTLIWGGITSYDHATFLNSVTGEWLFHDDNNGVWGRLEVLQRTPAELAVVATEPDSGRWVAALTAGYTHRLASLSAFDFSVGGSATLDFLPNAFSAAYGGNAIFAAKLFLECRVVKMLAFGRRR